MLNSRTKGKRGELELAAFLREHGYDARRGQQFKGGQDTPDVIGLPGIHIECKRIERGNLYDWLQQAINDAGNAVPIVAHRRNRREWVAILRLEDLLTILKRDRPNLKSITTSCTIPFK